MVQRHVVGYYDTEAEAIVAIENLKNLGFTSDEISVISKKTERIDHITDETGTSAAEDVTRYNDHFEEGKIIVPVDGNYERTDDFNILPKEVSLFKRVKGEAQR